MEKPKNNLHKTNIFDRENAVFFAQIKNPPRRADTLIQQLFCKYSFVKKYSSQKHHREQSAPLRTIRSAVPLSSKLCECTFSPCENV